MRRLIVCVVFCVLIRFAPAQTAGGQYLFTTVAGRPLVTGSIDGASANARFNRPWGIGLDAAGNIYVSEAVNHTLRKITPSGLVTTLAGQALSPGLIDGSASAARFGGTETASGPSATGLTGPFGLAVDAAGNAWVADQYYSVIRRVTTSLGVATYAGVPNQRGLLDALALSAWFSLPLGVAVDSSGAVFVADTFNHVIRRISANGIVTTIAGSATWGTSDGVGSAARFLHPTAIAVAPSGNVYVTDCANTVRRLTPTSGGTQWQVSTIAGSPLTYGFADGVGADARFGGEPSPSSTPGGITVRYRATGSIRNGSPTFVNVSYTMADLPGIAVDAAENVYVSDFSNNAIRKISRTGVVTTIGGSLASGATDGAGNVARFSGPTGIAIDANGALYIADSFNHVIRKGELSGDPFIQTQPANQAVVAGANVVFTVGFSATPPTLVQWSRNGVPIPGANSVTLSLTNVQPDQAGSYVATITNSLGTATSAAAVLSVVSTPVITTPPTSQTVAGAGSLSLNVAAIGPAPLTFQWTRNGIAVPGATAASLVIANAQDEHAGEYRVVVTSPNGSVTSVPALVTVDTGRLVNLSIRSAVAGSDALIVGFVVAGGPKPMLVRAVGPALQQFGLATAMADPQLTLFRSGTVVLTNDNWSTAGSVEIAGAAASAGAFPLTANSLDSAVFLPLADSVTAQASSRTNAGGVVLVELYGTGPVTAARLANVSTRARVGVGENALFGGFSIGGSSARTLLIRAVGPTLGAFGVGGVLANPLLEIFAGSSTTARYVNDNWNGEANLVAVFTRVGAFPLPASGSRDAALMATFEPGTYSAKISGVGNTTGEVLLEIYELP